MLVNIDIMESELINHTDDISEIKDQTPIITISEASVVTQGLTGTHVEAFNSNSLW